MHVKRVIAAVGAACFMAGAAHAVDGDLIFTGPVADLCVITPGTAGVLAPTADGTQLTTESTTGALAEVFTTSGAYTIELVPPTGFDLPLDAPEDVSFTGAINSTAGVSDLLDVVENVAEPLGLGLSALEIDMTATRDEGTFPAGVYTATATLRCVAES